MSPSEESPRFNAPGANQSGILLCLAGGVVTVTAFAGHSMSSSGWLQAPVPGNGERASSTYLACISSEPCSLLRLWHGQRTGMAHLILANVAAATFGSFSPLWLCFMLPWQSGFAGLAQGS